MIRHPAYPFRQRDVEDARGSPVQPHTEPSPELFEIENATEVEVTDALRAQWEREGVTSVMQIRYVGTCHTNGCKAEAER